MTTRGLGVSQQDLAASRLVFVSVKDAKPKRKVAVPIPENGSWDVFLGQIKGKLKLAGVGEIFLASTGERVVRLDQLQDIDELYVVEAANDHTANGGSSSSQPSDGGYGVAGKYPTEISPSGAHADVDSDNEGKYVKRQTSLQRTAKRLFPSLFAQTSLPITNKDTVPLSPVEQVRRRIKRRRRTWTDPRTVLIIFALISCFGTLVFVYLKASQGLP